MPNQWDLTGENIENTYQRVLQTPDGVNIFDGTGSLFHLGVFNSTSTGSYGSFYDTGSQTAVLATTIYSMSLSTTAISNGVYVDNTDKTKIYVTNPGVYDFQFSAQFSNTGNNPSDVYIWIRKNDNSFLNDVPDSSGIVTVPAKKGSIPGQTIIGWNYFLTLAAGDFIQFLWHTHDDNIITLETIPAGVSPVHPLTPSLIVTANRVDTFFSNTGSFSGSFIGTHTGSFTGSFTGSLLGTASWADSASQALTASYYQETDPIFVAKSASLATTGSNTFVGNQVVSGSYIIDVSSSVDALRVTQRGDGNAIIVEDSANPDATPFVVAADGRVGIGVTAPLSTYKLHVRNGTVTNSVTWGGSVGVFENSGSNAYLSVLSSDTFTAGVGFGTADHRVSANVNWNSTTKAFNLATNTASAYLVFGTDDGTERMRITSGGLVGINTTNPQYILDVSGSSRITGDLTVTGIIDGGTF